MLIIGTAQLLCTAWNALLYCSCYGNTLRLQPRQDAIQIHSLKNVWSKSPRARGRSDSLGHTGHFEQVSY